MEKRHLETMHSSAGRGVFTDPNTELTECACSYYEAAQVAATEEFVWLGAVLPLKSFERHYLIVALSQPCFEGPRVG